jgi:hypothetical protein
MYANSSQLPQLKPTAALASAQGRAPHLRPHLRLLQGLPLAAPRLRPAAAPVKVAAAWPRGSAPRLGGDGPMGLLAPEQHHLHAPAGRSAQGGPEFKTAWSRSGAESAPSSLASPLRRSVPRPQPNPAARSVPRPPGQGLKQPPRLKQPLQLQRPQQLGAEGSDDDSGVAAKVSRKRTPAQVHRANRLNILCCTLDDTMNLA